MKGEVEPMIEFTRGSILADDSDALVNTVNTVGVMGRGVALQFKKEWPENFRAYAEACRQQEVQPGRMFVFETSRLDAPRYIINFPTKRHWRGKSRIEDIESGLRALEEVIRDRRITSVAIPPLGSGLGGLDWSTVRARIIAALGHLEGVRVRVYEPTDIVPPATIRHVRDVPRMTAGRAALVGLVDRYLGGLLDPFVTLLEVHKLMYFLQEAGEPLRLRFQKGHYGPYAENLRHVLNAIEGHYLTGFDDGGDQPGKRLSLVTGAVEEANTCLATHTATHHRFGRVAHLVDGFESPHGLELLSTVDWVLIRETPPENKSLVRAIHDWSPAKAAFTPRQIALAAETLETRGWLTRTPTVSASV